MSTASSNGNYVTAARRALKMGHTVEAQRYLKLALQDDPQNVAAWLWLAGIAPSAEKARGYIARAEMLQPDHPAISKAKQWLEQKHPHPPVPPTRQKQAAAKQKRPFSLSPIHLLRGGMVAVMFILLLGAGWVLRQQLSNQSAANTLSILTQSVTEPKTGAVSPSSTPTTAVPTLTPIPVHIAAKNITQHSPPRATWTVTPTPSPTPTATPTIQPTFISLDYNSGVRPFGVSGRERWIDVNLTTQTLIAYEGDTAVYNALVSSGVWDHPTVTGQFRIWLRYESQTMNGALLGYDYYLENVPYVMYFFEDYAIHGAYWHNNFGTPMSHGCVNVHPTDAAWLYNWASISTLVNVHY